MHICPVCGAEVLTRSLYCPGHRPHRRAEHDSEIAHRRLTFHTPGTRTVALLLCRVAWLQSCGELGMIGGL